MKSKQPNKTLSTNSKTKQTQFNACNTGVNPIRTHGFGVWGNRRIPKSYRVDEKLAEASKPVLQAIFGSECRGVEAFLAGLVATYEAQGIGGVYPTNTVEIGKLVIERNLRSRRKLVVEEEIEETTKVKRLTCEFHGCNREATFEVYLPRPYGFKGSAKDLTKLYCEVHMKNSSKLGYRPIQEIRV